MRMIVGKITAKEHRGRLRIIIVANTGEVLAMDLDAVAAAEFRERLEAAPLQKNPC